VRYCASERRGKLPNEPTVGSGMENTKVGAVNSRCHMVAVAPKWTREAFS
jgi:hypothetical protein